MAQQRVQRGLYDGESSRDGTTVSRVEPVEERDERGANAEQGS
jgi:hypothetical protein